MISVIVPIYNVEAYLKRCVESIIYQTYQDIEIILVDDGSKDESGNIADTFSELDNRVKVFHKSNGGLSDARNYGLERASGEYICFIDSDDYIHKEMLEILYNTAINHNADLVICDFFWINDGEVTLDNEETLIVKITESPFSILKENALLATVAWNKLYKKEIFEAGIRYPVGYLHEDEFVIHRILKECSCVVTINKKLYYYIKREGSIVSLFSNKRVKDALLAFYDRIKFMKIYGNIDDQKEAVARMYQHINHVLFIDKSRTYFNSFMLYLFIKKLVLNVCIRNYELMSFHSILESAVLIINIPLYKWQYKVRENKYYKKREKI